MKQVLKVGLGVFAGLFLCALVTLAAIVWYTPSRYDQCFVQCAPDFTYEHSEIVSQLNKEKATNPDITYKQMVAKVLEENCAKRCAPLYRTGIPFVIEVLERLVHNLAP